MDKPENLHGDARAFHQFYGASVYRIASHRILEKMHFYAVPRTIGECFSKCVRYLSFPKKKIFECDCALRRTNRVQHCREDLIAILQRCNFVSCY